MIVTDTKTFQEFDMAFKYIELLYDADAYQLLISKNYLTNEFRFDINEFGKRKEKKIASLLFEKYGNYL